MLFIHLFHEYLLVIYYIQNHVLSTVCGYKDKEDIEMHKNKMHDQLIKLPAVKCYLSMRCKVGRLSERSGQND